MKLCAIYICWSDWDILKYSLKNIEPLVDGVIIVGSYYSNFGEFCDIPVEFHGMMHIREPQFKSARESETDKRNFGLQLARKAGYTHFLTMDADEFYEPEEFLREKEWFKSDYCKNTKTVGVVGYCQTYFKSPKLTIGNDVTLVPFIHELTPTIKHEFNRNYPYAWSKHQIRIDPTRSFNINSGVLMSEITMHHMSWVRKDYNRKIRNSTARTNLERSCILTDLLHAKEGGFCEYYQKPLVRASVDFEIPEYEFNQSSNTAVR